MALGKQARSLAVRGSTKVGGFALIKAIQVVIALTVGAVFGWYADLPGGPTTRGERVTVPWERWRAHAAAVTWPAAAVGTTYYAQDWRWLAASALITAWAGPVLARRTLAGLRGEGLPLRVYRSMLRRWAIYYLGGDADVRPGRLRRTLPFIAAFALWLAPLAGSALLGLSVHLLAVAPVMLLAVVAVFSLRECAWRKRTEPILPFLAVCVGVNEEVVRSDMTLMPKRGKGVQQFVTVSLGAKVLARLDGIETKCATVWPDYECKVHRDQDSGAVRSILWTSTGEVEAIRRELVAQSGGLVTSLNPKPPLNEVEAVVRPDQHIAELAEGVTATKAQHVHEWAQRAYVPKPKEEVTKKRKRRDEEALDASSEAAGPEVPEHPFALVKWDEGARVVILSRLSPQVLKIRERFANLLGCYPWDLEVYMTAVDDEVLGRKRIEKVVVGRHPVIGHDPEKRLEKWQGLVLALPDGSTSWDVEESATTGVVTLTYRQPRELEPQVGLADIGLAPVIDPEQWYRLPVGLNPEGKVVALDLRAGPHIGIGGATGSGKSVSIRTLLGSALLRGHEIVMIDPKKACGDFKAYEPYARAWGDESLEQAADILDAVYEEGVRRKKILRSLALPNIWEMTPEQRAAHGIKPLFVIFDEYQSATVPKDMPKGLPPGHPIVQKVQAHNYAVARIENVAQSGVLELRFVGIHFGFAGQVVSAKDFGSTLRANLSSVLVCVPKVGSVMPKREILGMQFGDSAPEALDLIAELNSHDPGLAITMGEDGNLDACRVAFAQPAEITALLDAAGVSRPEVLQVVSQNEAPKFEVLAEKRTASLPAPPSARVSEPTPVVTAPEVDDAGVEIDLGDFSLDDPCAAAESTSGPVADFAAFDFGFGDAATG